jgi:hypothetical protein
MLPTSNPQLSKISHIPDCPHLFPASSPNTGRALTLLNQMTVSSPFLEGRLVKTEDGSILEHPKNSTYEIPVDFVGSFSITLGGGQ